MRKAVGILVSAAATLSLMGAMAPSANAAPKAHCKGSNVKRCVAVSKGKYTKIKIGNYHRYAIDGQFGVSCIGGKGQKGYVLKDSPVKARSWWKSKRVTCPKGYRQYAYGWWMDTNGDVYYSPEVDF
jgi:hypothetical protein